MYNIFLKLALADSGDSPPATLLTGQMLPFPFLIVKLYKFDSIYIHVQMKIGNIFLGMSLHLHLPLDGFPSLF